MLTNMLMPHVSRRTWPGWLFFAVCAILLAALCAAAAQPDGFTCEDAARAELIDQPTCFVRIVRRTAECRKYPPPPGSQFTSKVKMALLKERIPVANSTNILVCLAQDQHQWFYGNVNISISFTRSLIVGAVLMDESCLNRNRSDTCIRRVLLRKEILQLPTMVFPPEDTRFWNFSSPLFQGGWLTAFSMNGRYQAAKPSSAVNALDGSSVSDLRLAGIDRYDYVLPPLGSMRGLKYLQLSVGINVGRAETFEGVPNLQFLTLKNSRLHAIPPGVRYAKNLQLLSVTDNKIRNATEELTHLPRLQQLALDDNPLGPDSPVFPQMPGLWMLSLIHCGITSFSGSTFRGLPRLRVLNLSRNEIHYLDPLVFASLPQLDNLWIEQCGLTKWPTHALKGLRLGILSLRQNSLWTMANLGHLKNSVRYLDVSNNKIGEWDDPRIFSCRGGQEEASLYEVDQRQIRGSNRTACYNGSWLQELQIQSNLIRTINSNMRTSFDGLKKLYADDNPIDCGDCDTPRTQQWLNATPLRIAQPLLCAAPSWDKGTPLAQLQFDGRPCLQPLRRLLMGALVPVLVAASLLSAGGATAYLWRTEIAYLAHLLRIRRSSRRPDARARHNQYDAFVCYSGKNRKWVMRRLARLLELPPDCYRVCLFDRDFRLGSHIVSNIVDAIDRSSKVIVVLTQHFIDSKWCQWELEMANHKLFGEDREFLVLLELEPLERARLPRLLRFLLDTRPVVRWPRPETAPAVLQAGAQLRRALGPSLRQLRQRRDAAARPGCSGAADERPPLLVAQAAHVI